jgi:hypothetical protein
VHAALEPMLEQHVAAYGQMPAMVLLDAGFGSCPVLALMVKTNIDVVCPSGRVSNEEIGSDGAEAAAGFPIRPFNILRRALRAPAGAALDRARRCGGRTLTQSLLATAVLGTSHLLLTAHTRYF